MDYLHVKNLEEFNPGYKDRELIWCKVYFSMINANPEFELLCETDKWRFVAFIMLELQTKKPVPLDPDYLIRKGFDLKKRSISLTLQMLHNSIEVCNAGVTQSRVEKIRIDKSIEDKKESIPTSAEPVRVLFVNNNSTEIEADKFFDYFSSNGWKIGGKAAMKDWRAAARNWIRRIPKKEVQRPAYDKPFKQPQAKFEPETPEQKKAREEFFNLSKGLANKKQMEGR